MTDQSYLDAWEWLAEAAQKRRDLQDDDEMRALVWSIATSLADSMRAHRDGAKTSVKMLECQQEMNRALFDGPGRVPPLPDGRDGYGPILIMDQRGRSWRRLAGTPRYVYEGAVGTWTASAIRDRYGIRDNG